MASKPEIRGRIILAVGLSFLAAAVAQFAGLQTHLGAWNHRLDPGYEWCFLPAAKIDISKMQQGLDSPHYHYQPGPHIRFPGFEYVQVYPEYRIPWRANVSTFYTLALPVTVLAFLYGCIALRRRPGSSG